MSAASIVSSARAVTRSELFPVGHNRAEARSPGNNASTTMLTAHAARNLRGMWYLPVRGQVSGGEAEPDRRRDGMGDGVQYETSASAGTRSRRAAHRPLRRSSFWIWSSSSLIVAVFADTLDRQAAISWLSC